MKRVRALQGPFEVALQQVAREMREREGILIVEGEQSVEDQSQWGNIAVAEELLYV